MAAAHSYAALSSAGEEKYRDFESNSETETATELIDRGMPQDQRIPFIYRHATFLMFSNIFLCLMGVSTFLIGLSWRLKSDDVCFDKHSFYSPINSNVDHKYYLVLFNGSLEADSPYRGTPNPSIDKAWDRITKAGMMSVTAEDIVKSKMSLEAVRYPPELGDGGYAVQIEVNHQLHCLNFLRKATYMDYYKDKAEEFTDKDFIVRKHLDHCIEMLRQNLMCNADTGIITNHWVKHYTARPYPNFNTWHKCRNFEAVLKEVKSRHVHFEPGEEIPMVPGSKIFSTPP